MLLYNTTSTLSYEILITHNTFSITGHRTLGDIVYNPVAPLPSSLDFHVQ